MFRVYIHLSLIQRKKLIYYHQLLIIIIIAIRFPEILYTNQLNTDLVTTKVSSNIIVYIKEIKSVIQSRVQQV